MYYLAYGSNLHPLRLQERVPSARVLGVVELPGQHLNFHKLSKDTSGKCNLYAAPASLSYGVLYEFSSDHKAGLDAAEGLGSGYARSVLSVTFGGAPYQPFVYLASPSHVDTSLQPFHWYKALVLAGAQHHNLPAAYISQIETVPSIADQDHKRVMRYGVLLARMAEIQRAM